MGALRGWREPAVIVLLVVVAFRQLMVVALAVADRVGTVGSYALAIYQAAGQAAEPLALVLLTALLVGCHIGPPTPRARLLTVLGLVVVAVAVLVQLVAGVLGLRMAQRSGLPDGFGTLTVVESVLDLVVPVLALLTLAVLLRRPAADSPEQPALPATASSEVDLDEAEPDPALQPTWQPDVATGAVWLSAGDAASGRPPTAAPVGDQDEPHPWATGPR